MEQAPLSEPALAGREAEGFFRRLVAVTVFVNLLVSVIVGYALVRSHRHHCSLAVITTKNMVTGMEGNLCNILDKINVGLAAVAREAEEEIAAGGIEAVHLNRYIAGELPLLPELYGIRVTDAMGNIRYGFDPPLGTTTTVADREYFRRLREAPHGQLIMSRLLRGKVYGNWMLVLATRINRPDGSFAGGVLGLFDVSYFEKLLAHLDIGPHGAIGIRDEDLHLVALKPKGLEPGSQIGSDVISEKTREMIRLHPVTATYNTVFARDHRERTVTFRKAANYPFYVFATASPSDYLARWRKEAAIELALLGVFMIATVVAARTLRQGKISEMLRAQASRYGEKMEQRNEELNAALSRVRRLEGIISICSYCKKVRTDEQSWEQVEKYITENSDATFSHGMCPACSAEQTRLFHQSLGRFERGEVGRIRRGAEGEDAAQGGSRDNGEG
ncbi:hypothetical protein GMSM_18160 [Geomonas sp. Red276]